MRKWISVLLLVIVVSTVSGVSLISSNVPTQPSVISPLSHGEGG